MQSINNGTNGSSITTLTKFIFIALVCILVNIPLYFMQEKLIPGLYRRVDGCSGFIISL